jgi:hypothetical protein
MKRDETCLDLLRRLDGPHALADLARRLGFEPTRIRSRTTAKTQRPATRDHRSIVGRRTGAELILLQLHQPIDRNTLHRHIRHIRDENLARHALVVSTSDWTRLTFAAAATDGSIRHLSIDRQSLRAVDADAIDELTASHDDNRVSLALRHARALDRARIGTRFFNDFRAARGTVAANWKGIPTSAVDDRNQLALLLLSRLLFLYFLQHRGHLAGQRDYLADRLHTFLRKPGSRSFYRAVLRPLFFGALNRRPHERDEYARALGSLPYLNGGLFERHELERQYGRLDLPDETCRHIIDDLLERHRFSSREADSTETHDAIDPEMLGRVFEGVMGSEHRTGTGTYFTPRTTVDRLVHDAVAAWLAPHISPIAGSTLLNGATPDGVTPPAAARHEQAEPLIPGQDDTMAESARQRAARALASIRVLDPACGSGAFLVGALAHIGSIRAALENRPAHDVRRDLVAHTLHGVDIQPDAALLCALRLWLALADSNDDVSPLPNLDRRIRQGDALLDPLDLLLTNSHAPRPAVRAAIRSLQPLTRDYLDAGPRDRNRIRQQITAAERDLARAWIDAIRQQTRNHTRELHCQAADRDLFGQIPTTARRALAELADARRRMTEIHALRRRIRNDRAVPFFSFHVHFAHTESARFDIVLSNPPWIRAHRWPATLREIARKRYAICRNPGWRAGTALSGAPAAAAAQIDIALLFLERALALLATNGILAMVLPARTFRSLYAAAARRRILTEMQLVSITDHSLDHRRLFDADAFAATLIARNTSHPTTTHDGLTRITLHHQRSRPLEFHSRTTELPLFRDDPESPWLLAPPTTVQALRRMQLAGPPLGHDPRLRIRRGVFTGANDVLLVPEATPHIGGLATMRALGFFRNRAGQPHDRPADDYQAIVESASLRPIVRGATLDAWKYDDDGFVIWSHADDTSPAAAPRYLQRYLLRHAPRLSRRSGIRSHDPIGKLLRVTTDSVSTKLAWRDIATTLQAAVLPALCRSSLGDVGPVIPLNTLYFLPFDDTDTALLLAAFLNSTPYRTFARTAAERAKDARFRFFAWTIGALPLPTLWSTCRNAPALLRIARQAHADDGISDHDQQRLDDLVAATLRLRPPERDALDEFHHWLNGAPPAPTATTEPTTRNTATETRLP